MRNKDIVIPVFEQLVVFNLDDRLFALRLTTVERVIRMVEVTRLVRSSPTLLGVVNVEGRIIPVYNMRRLLQFQERDPDPADQMILANLNDRTVALVTDSVVGVLEVSPEDVVQPDDIVPAMNCVEGIVRRDDGMIILYRLEELLAPEPDDVLQEPVA